MSLNRVCQIEDFDEPEMRTWLREAGYDPDDVVRKAWEVSLAYRVMRSAVTRKGARVLGVGAGMEPSLFLMTRHGEVHATDLYADAGIWEGAAPRAMLTDPARCAPAGLDWAPERLIVQHMDGRALRYPDGHFDAVFSSSSLEHFGSRADIQQAAREIGRVLRPGGVATIATEFQIGGEGRGGWPGVVVFDEAALRRDVIDPSGLALLEPLATAVSEATRETAVALEHCVALIERGQALPRPHIALSHAGQVFTSVHIALRKPKE